MMKSFDLSLYLVTDRSLTGGRSIDWIVEQAIKGGVTMVQLREKECPTGAFIDLAFRLRQITLAFNIPLIINDRIDVALAVDADGVHVGQSDISCKLARQLLGPDKIIGLSVETIAQARLANELDVDYIGISPVFGTMTKSDISLPLGLEGLKNIACFSRHPMVGIGGIDSRNARSIMDAGAHGVAVVSAIIADADPRQAALLIKQKISKQ